MLRIASHCVCLALLAMAVGGARADAAALLWLSPEARLIQVERQTLERTLATLPPAPEPVITERLGHHSRFSLSAEDTEWVQLDLRKSEAVDSVVLIAAPSASGGASSAGYGFPVRFRVELRGEALDEEGEIIADFTREDFPNPGALPVLLPAGGRHGRFVRIIATRLYSENGRHFFALGEVMVLQGRRNLAARLSQRDVRATSSMGTMPVWGKANLVDGDSVVGPPVGRRPSPSLGYQSLSFPIQRGNAPAPAPRWVQVDMGRSVPVDEVRLFPAHPPEFAHRPGYGYPPVLKVELAEAPDFSDAFKLTDLPGSAGADPLGLRDPVMPGDNVVTYPAPGRMARYVRVTAVRPFDAVGTYHFALAELQVWSGDENVALGKTVTAYDSDEGNGWSRAALVDGFTSRANIVDWPEWLAGLSRRREAAQRVRILDAREAALVSGYKKLGWRLLGGVLAVAMLVLLAINLLLRRARRREMEALRQRISEDLHDEIGSSLGSIGFIAQDACAMTQDEQVRRELDEIGSIARETLESMRDIVRLAQTGKYGQGDLTAHLCEIGDRLLRGIPHTLNTEAAGAFNQLPMHQRRDLVLMFKEALHNLVRHAHATEAEITLAQSNGSLSLTVRDNGCGFDPEGHLSEGLGLTNLHRRAVKHGGSIQIASAPAKGATITIILPRPA